MQKLPEAHGGMYEKRSHKKKRNRPGERRNPFPFSAADGEK